MKEDVNLKQIGYKIRNSLINFMQGRNGADGIFTFCVCVYLLLWLVNFFAGSAVLLLIEQAVLIYALFRFLSKNLYKRRAENARFMAGFNRVKKFIIMRETMAVDKSHYYKKCPDCKNILRMNRVKGEHTVKCPCGKKFKVNIRR